jgi:hypothetical protein
MPELWDITFYDEDEDTEDDFFGPEKIQIEVEDDGLDYYKERFISYLSKIVGITDESVFVFGCEDLPYDVDEVMSQFGYSRGNINTVKVGVSFNKDYIAFYPDNSPVMSVVKDSPKGQNHKISRYIIDNGGIYVD